MNLGIRGKLALVVGASKGVGRAVALELAVNGAEVIAVARDGDRLDALMRELIEVSRSSHYCRRSDLMADGNVTRLCDSIRADIGTPDIIYHCIGGSVEGIKDWTKPASEWAKVWRFNLGIAHDINVAFAPGMIAKGWGRIVHTSSDATKCNSGNCPYSTSKFAVEGYVKTVSKQLSKHGVIMTCIAPGNVFTLGHPLYEKDAEGTERYFDEHLPIRRWAQNEEIAKVIAFLCSEGASFMPGAIVRADGGSR